MGARLAGAARDQPRTDHAPRFGLRAIRSLQGPARLRPHRPRRRRPRVSLRHAQGHTRHARLDDAGRLSVRPFRLRRRPAGLALQGEDGPRPVHRHCALRVRLPLHGRTRAGVRHVRHRRRAARAAHHEACPYGHFPTRDGKWVAIACTTDKLFARLAEAMGRSELASSSLYGEQKTRWKAGRTWTRSCATGAGRCLGIRSSRGARQPAGRPGR